MDEIDSVKRLSILVDYDDTTNGLEKKGSLWNTALEIVLQMVVKPIGEDAVIARGFDFPSDDDSTYRELAGQHGEPIKPVQQKPEPNVQDEKSSPDQLSTPDHSEDIAEKKKVTGHDRNHPP